MTADDGLAVGPPSRPCSLTVADSAARAGPWVDGTMINALAQLQALLDALNALNEVIDANLLAGIVPQRFSLIAFYARHRQLK